MDTLACQTRKNVAKCDNSSEMRTAWLFEILNANCAPQILGGPICLSAKIQIIAQVVVVVQQQQLMRAELQITVMGNINICSLKHNPSLCHCNNRRSVGKAKNNNNENYCDRHILTT